MPSLTGVVGFWATVALNIPDFTRYARSQRAQVLGQALGLPTTMTFYSFIGVAVTSATVIIFGQTIWDPVQVLARLGNPIAVVVAMLALLLATLNVNVAANLVSPSNDFSNLSPRLISFRTGGLIACVVGVVVFQPWKLLANFSNYIFGWLVGYSGFLGPIAGVMICDYFVVRKKIILVEDLYQRSGFYEFSGGINLARDGGAGRRSGRGVHRPDRAVIARAVRLRVVRGIRRELRRVLGPDAAKSRKRVEQASACWFPVVLLKSTLEILEFNRLKPVLLNHSRALKIVFDFPRTTCTCAARARWPRRAGKSVPASSLQPPAIAFSIPPACTSAPRSRRATRNIR